ncbi:MAG TPA: hypothetical protein V6D10_23380 [Trichocoleus sp.]
MDLTLQRAAELKQALTDFVLDAEGDLATALEAFSAQQMTRSKQQDMHQRNLVVDRFIFEGQVDKQTPIDLFLQDEPELSESDRQLLQTWRHSFVGLFAVSQVLEDGFALMNWTTAKHYLVQLTSPEEAAKMLRLKEGEIILAQISPVAGKIWMFSSPVMQLGKLGKPKLAVAIGNFKENYKNHLYSDAPELLAEAWKSVEQYHQDFVDFFGSNEVTLPGYQLNKKIQEFQELMTKKRLESAGIDESKSLEELAAESGISQEEIAEAAESMGADAKEVSQFFDSKGKAKMVMPKVDLPDSLKKAEQVTVLTHPRWGQAFLPTYHQFIALLEAEDWTTVSNGDVLVRRYLEDPEIPTFVWYRLAEQYPDRLEAVLQSVLSRPEFELKHGLDSVLQEFNKSIETELPEIASVPIHLHNLFQEAIQEISKDKSKAKVKRKTAAGF